MLRAIFRRRMRDAVSGCEVTNQLFSFRVNVPSIENELSRGGFGEAGYEVIELVGIEVERPDDNPHKKPRGVWIEFADDGEKVVDILHEPKDADMPDGYVWCEEGR